MNLGHKNYDFIFSLGEDCACTGYLRAQKLQEESFPFDWLTKASFDSRIELLINDFTDFINEEDFSILEKNPTSNTDQHYDYYNNEKTGFYFYHDFPVGEDFKKAFPSIKEKYQRRIERLYNRINNANSVLVVWLSRNKHIQNDNILRAHSELLNKFPNKIIDFLILENDSDKLHLEFDIQKINDNIIKIKYDNSSYDKSNPMAECMGNKEASNIIFAKLNLLKNTKGN